MIPLPVFFFFFSFRLMTNRHQISTQILRSRKLRLITNLVVFEHANLAYDCRCFGIGSIYPLWNPTVCYFVVPSSALSKHLRSQERFVFPNTTWLNKRSFQQFLSCSIFSLSIRPAQRVFFFYKNVYLSFLSVACHLDEKTNDYNLKEIVKHCHSFKEVGWAGGIRPVSY